MRHFILLRPLFLGLALLTGLNIPAEAVEYKAGSLRDPFTDFSLPPEPEPEAEKPQVTEEAMQTLVLQGLLITPKKSRAIINGKIVDVGTVLPAGKVEKISKDGVSVLYNGKSYMLRPKERKMNDKQKNTKTVAAANSARPGF